jgi:antirestriction protein ArdC
MLLYNYEYPFFVGFSQAKSMGWSIKKGSKSTWIRFGATNLKETEDPDTGNINQELHRYFKWFNVFNVACLDDSHSTNKISDRVSALSSSKVNTEPPIALVESFINRHTPKTQFGGDRAFYHPATDTIRLPHYTDFKSAIAYYSNN